MPDYVNNVQGTITQTDNAMSLAITGQGFFAVSQETGGHQQHRHLQPATIL